MIHLRRVPTVRYNSHSDLLELRKVVLQEILDLPQVSRILHKPLNLPPFEIVIQAVRYDFMVILLPFFEDRVFLAKCCQVDIDLEAFGEARDLFITMWNYMAIIVELEVHVASKLVVLDAHTSSCIDFLFNLVVYWGSEHEVRATRLDKDRKHKSIRWVDDLLVIDVKSLAIPQIPLRIAILRAIALHQISLKHPLQLCLTLTDKYFSGFFLFLVQLIPIHVFKEFFCHFTRLIIKVWY